MSTSPRSILFVLAIAAAACGDSGTTDGTSGSGGGSTSAGTGGSTTTTGTTTSTTTTTTTTSTTGATTGAGGGEALTFTASDCETECGQAQMTQGCTTLTGNCQSCCAAAVNLANDSGCQAAFNDYYACISAPADPCNPTPVDCTAQQGALQDCATTYCTQVQLTADCIALNGCFSAG